MATKPPTGSATRTSCPASGWRRAALPGESASLANDVVALQGRLAWVVGNHAGRGRSRSPWIVRNTSHGWRTVAAAATGGDSGLMAIDMARPDDGWAVGYLADGRLLRPISQHWDGGRWAASAVPWPGSGSATLGDVDMGAGGATWAVGYRTTARGARPFAVARVAGRWVRRDPGLPSGTQGSLVAVAATSAHDVWSVGWQDGGRGVRPLLLHWDGARWLRIPGPTVAAGEAMFTDVVAQAADDVWLAGYRIASRRYDPVLAHWDGTTWAAVNAPSDPSRSFITQGLAIDDQGQPILAGMSRTDENAGFAATVATSTDAGWAVSVAPAGAHGPSDLRAVAWSRGGTMSVGFGGPAAIAVVSCHRLASAAPALHLAAASTRFAEAEPTAADPTQPAPDLAVDGAAVISAADELATTAADVSAAGVRFRDVAREAGLAERTITYGATRLDFNADGWDDLLISRHTDQARLLRNDHGTFVDAAAGPLPARDRHGCAAGDVNADGRDEAYCAIGAAKGAKFKIDELWTDLGQRTAHNLAGGFGVDDPLARGRRATFMDLNGDRFPDLYVTNDPLRVDGLPSINRLFRNEAGSGFVPVPEMGLDLPIGGECALSADLDKDGQAEVILCTDEPWGSGRGLHVFARGQGGFQDVTARLGLAPRGDIDAVAVDLDGDHRLDLVQLSPSRLEVHLQRNGRFELAYSRSLNGGKALAAGDANGDGRMDLFVVQAGSDRLLLNDGSGRRFASLAMPDAGGSPDDVVAIDYDRNGLTDFLVLNGASLPGPIQLIAGFRGSR